MNKTYVYYNMNNYQLLTLIDRAKESREALLDAKTFVETQIESKKQSLLKLKSYSYRRIKLLKEKEELEQILAHINRLLEDKK